MREVKTLYQIKNEAADQGYRFINVGDKEVMYHYKNLDRKGYFYQGHYGYEVMFHKYANIVPGRGPAIEWLMKVMDPNYVMTRG